MSGSRSQSKATPAGEKRGEKRPWEDLQGPEVEDPVAFRQFMVVCPHPYPNAQHFFGFTISFLCYCCVRPTARPSPAQLPPNTHPLFQATFNCFINLYLTHIAVCNISTVSDAPSSVATHCPLPIVHCPLPTVHCPLLFFSRKYSLPTSFWFPTLAHPTSPHPFLSLSVEDGAVGGHCEVLGGEGNSEGEAREAAGIHLCPALPLLHMLFRDTALTPHPWHHTCCPLPRRAQRPTSAPRTRPLWPWWRGPLACPRRSWRRSGPPARGTPPPRGPSSWRPGMLHGLLHRLQWLGTGQ
jgi:hypothetical protein